MKDKIDSSMTIPIEETEELTPFEREIMTGWMSNPHPEPKYRSTDKVTIRIAEQLRICRQEFVKLEIHAEVDFYEYLQHSYGIQLRIDHIGNVLDTYDVIDEKKFMIFKLKFSA